MKAYILEVILPSEAKINTNDPKDVIVAMVNKAIWESATFKNGVSLRGMDYNVMLLSLLN